MSEPVANSVFVAILVGLLLIFGTAAYAGLKAAPWVPTRRRDMARLLDTLALKPGQKVYDLGAGDGRLVLTLARLYQVQAVGLELSLLPYVYAKLRTALYRGPGKAEIRYGDFYKTDLSDADAVVCFLTPMAMQRLAPKFKHELKKGARIASYAFPLPHWQELEKNKPTSKDTPVWVYRV